SPRPTRVLGVFEPGAGRRWCSLSACSSAISVHLFPGDEVAHGIDHAADLRTIVLHHHVVDPLETQRAQGLALILLAADLRLQLRDLELRHQEFAPSFARRSAAGATSSTGRPRRAATSSGRSRPLSAAIVACTMLIAFEEPSDL